MQSERSLAPVNRLGGILHRSAGTPIALLVTALGVVLILQGWKSRIPNFDMLTAIDAAQQVIDHGRLPDRGVVTSFGSFTPPGLTWLMLPGVALFRDPRLFECVGSLALYAGTLLGIFLVARRYFGRQCALLAVVLYGFSQLGLMVGSTLFHRYPVQFFFVWVVYWVARWVDENNPRWLAAAIVTWAVGMNVFMEMAPAILVIPVVWLRYRPSIRMVPLVVAVTLAAAVWYPYLQFERERQFIDLRSQILRKSIHPFDFNKSWCDPSAAPASWLTEVARGQSLSASLSVESWSTSVRRWASERAHLIVDAAVASLKDPVPGAGVVLFLLTLIGLGASFVGTGVDTAESLERQDLRRRRVTWLAAGVALLALGLNEAVVARFATADGVLATASTWTIRVAEGSFLLAALLLIRFRDAVIAAATRVRRPLSRPAVDTRLPALVLTTPWVFLFLISDSDRRFWWLWPMHVIMLSAAVTYVPMRFKASRQAIWIGSAAVCFAVLWNPVLTARVASWRHQGWAARDAPEVQIVDQVASLMQARGEPSQVSIGYDIDIWRFMAFTHVIDPRYKVGADLDLLFKYRHGIANLNRCAEGFQARDRYRIVQVAPLETADEVEGHNRLSPPEDEWFQRRTDRETKSEPPYQVVQRF